MVRAVCIFRFLMFEYHLSKHWNHMRATPNCPNSILYATAEYITNYSAVWYRHKYYSCLLVHEISTQYRKCRYILVRSGDIDGHTQTVNTLGQRQVPTQSQKKNPLPHGRSTKKKEHHVNDSRYSQYGRRDERRKVCVRSATAA